MVLVPIGLFFKAPYSQAAIPQGFLSDLVQIGENKNRAVGARLKHTCTQLLGALDSEVREKHAKFLGKLRDDGVPAGTIELIGNVFQLSSPALPLREKAEQERTENSKIIEFHLSQVNAALERAKSQLEMAVLNGSSTTYLAAFKDYLASKEEKLSLRRLDFREKGQQTPSIMSGGVDGVIQRVLLSISNLELLGKIAENGSDELVEAHLEIIRGLPSLRELRFARPSLIALIRDRTHTSLNGIGPLDRVFEGPDRRLSMLLEATLEMLSKIEERQ